MNADSNTVNVVINSIENVGNNLEVNATFTYLNGAPYTGSVALKSTSPPGFSPSTQDWEYIPSNGLKTFLIQNRQLQDYDSITVYAEPLENNNASWYANSSWDSPLDNTTVNQSINQSGDNTTVDVDVNSSANSSIPIIIISNDTNSTIIINTDESGSGSGSITVNNTDNIQTVVPGKVTGGSAKYPSSYTGYKSVKSPVHNSNHNIKASESGVPMKNCGIDIIFPLFIVLFVISVFIWFKVRD